MEVKEGNKKRNLIVMVGVLAFVSLLYRVLLRFTSDNNYWWDHDDFAQTSLMFVGIPTLITLLVIVYAKTPKTAYGITFRTITLFLLMSSILLGEGTLCIILASPIFYGVGALIVYAREKSKKGNKMYSVGVFILLIAGLDIPQLVQDQKLHRVENTNIYFGNLTFKELEKSPDFMRNLPDLFKIGFPEPVKIEGTNLEIGARRAIDFKSATKGIGTLVLEIESINEDSLVFKPKSDNTHIDHWLTWKKVKVSLDHSKPNETRVTWTSEYVCDLGPAWYFEPIERYAVGVMNNHLMDSYFDNE